MAKGKKYTATLEKFSVDTLYSAEDALKMLKELAYANFDETVELNFNLGIDPRQAEQVIRGTMTLPNGSGKEMRVVVVCQEKDFDAVKEAGALEVGADDLIEKINKGWFGFDIMIASPDMMSKVGRLGKALGGRGLMPNPKSGTVTPDVAKAVKEFKSGKFEYRNDKTGIVHFVIGKVSFELGQLLENMQAVFDEIQKIKPQKTKGTYIKSLVLSSTMSPGIKVNPDLVSVKEL